MAFRNRDGHGSRGYSYESRPNHGRQDDRGGAWRPSEQKWRIKDTAWKSGTGKKPADNRDSGKLQPIISPYALEDPMYEYIQKKKQREKEERIRQLQALLDSSTTSSDSDDSDGSKRKKKKKQRKKKKKKKHSDSDSDTKDSTNREDSHKSKDKDRDDRKRKKVNKKQEKSDKKHKIKVEKDSDVWGENIHRDKDVGDFQQIKIKQERTEMTVAKDHVPSVPIKPDSRSIDCLLRDMRSQTDHVDHQVQVNDTVTRGASTNPVPQHSTHLPLKDTS